MLATKPKWFEKDFSRIFFRWVATFYDVLSNRKYMKKILEHEYQTKIT